MGVLGDPHAVEDGCGAVLSKDPGRLHDLTLRNAGDLCHPAQVKVFKGIMELLEILTPFLNK
ncbi:hypothetical protein ES703_87433 [subsurface metagenome]